MHSYNTYALFIEKHTGLPVYWSYTNSGDQDGRKNSGKPEYGIFGKYGAEGYSGQLFLSCSGR